MRTAAPLGWPTAVWEHWEHLREVLKRYGYGGIVWWHQMNDKTFQNKAGRDWKFVYVIHLLSLFSAQCTWLMVLNIVSLIFWTLVDYLLFFGMVHNHQPGTCCNASLACYLAYGPTSFDWHLVVCNCGATGVLDLLLHRDWRFPYEFLLMMNG